MLVRFQYYIKTSPTLPSRRCKLRNLTNPLNGSEGMCDVRGGVALGFRLLIRIASNTIGRSGLDGRESDGA